MNIFPLLYLFTSSLYLFLLIYVLAKNPEKKLNRVCAAFILCLAIWNFGDALMHSAELKSRAMLWENISSLGWIPFSSFFLWQALIISGKKKILKNSFFYFLIFSIPLFLIFRQWGGYLIVDFVRRPFGWGTLWSDSVWPYFFYFYYISFLFLSLFILTLSRFKTKLAYRKKQADLIILSSIIPIFGGTLTNVLLPRWGVYTVPPMAPLYSVIWAGGLVYAISRYGLMSITPETVSGDILETMSDALILVSVEEKIVFINRAAEKLLGYFRKELINRPASFIFKGSDIFFKEILNEIKGKDIKNKEVFLISKSREKIPVSLNCGLVTNKYNDKIGLAAVAYDLREIKEKESELKESYIKQMDMKKKLIRSQKLAMVGKISGSVSHRIREPLSNIKNTAFYLDRYSGIKSRDCRYYLDILSKEINHAEKIVETLREFSRPRKLKIRAVNIPEIVQQVIKCYESKADIEFKNKLKPEKETLKADPRKFKQLMDNLIKNACQSVRESGKVKVEIEEKNSNFLIKVGDTGEGMDKETLDSLFEPLYTTRPSGLGLGMTLVRDIIRDHSWKIKINSSKDKGTEILIYTGEN